MRMRLPEALSEYGCGGEVQAHGVREALEVLFARHPRLRERILDTQGGLHPHLLLFRNGVRASLDEIIAPDDEIEIFLAAEGG